MSFLDLTWLQILWTSTNRFYYNFKYSAAEAGKMTF